MPKPRGHSSAYPQLTEPYPTNPERASIPIEGGASVHTVKPLPALSLSFEEWETIGRKMNWIPNGFSRRGMPGGGAMWIEFHDREGRVEVSELSRDGIHDAEFQCTQMLEELETAKEKLDDAESEEPDEE